MGMKIEVKEDNSREILSEMEMATLRALVKVGMAAEANAKEICPVDTGRLRNSIASTVRDDSAYIGTNVEYAKYVELGTSRMDAQPYLKPAVVNHVSQYRAIVESVMRGS